MLQRTAKSAFLCVRPLNMGIQNIMKLRIPPKFHGPLCLLGFIAVMALVALIELIGGLQ